MYILRYSFLYLNLLFLIVNIEYTYEVLWLFFYTIFKDFDNIWISWEKILS